MRTRRYFQSVILSLFVCFVAIADPDEAKYSEEAGTAAEQLRRTIKEEIRSLGKHPWAGEYYRGDGFSVNVSLVVAPESGYVYEWYGCLGLQDRNYGPVSSASGTLKLALTYPNESRGLPSIAEGFIPVPWGRRVFLVPSNEVAGFCKRLNTKSGFSRFYLQRNRDEVSAKCSFLKSPDALRACLLETPLVAKIVAVGSSTVSPSVCQWTMSETPVTLGKGENAGFVTGMQLYLAERGDFAVAIFVSDVKDNTATALVTEMRKKKTAPEVGWKLSTKPNRAN